MALASLGALIAMRVTAGVNVHLDRDFAGEWRDSLRVKIFRPLGENAIKMMLRTPARNAPPRASG